MFIAASGFLYQRFKRHLPWQITVGPLLPRPPSFLARWFPFLRHTPLDDTVRTTSRDVHYYQTLNCPTMMDEDMLEEEEDEEDDDELLLADDTDVELLLA